MTIYKIEFTKAVKKQTDKLPIEFNKKIKGKLEILATNPRGPNTKKLVGWGNNCYRIRVGDYRIIYTIEDDIILVTVIRVSHRKNVYKGIA